jgi:hypothetical protein
LDTVKSWPRELWITLKPVKDYCPKEFGTAKGWLLYFVGITWLYITLIFGWKVVANQAYNQKILVRLYAFRLKTC